MKPSIYFLAVAFCASHAIAQPIPFTELRIPTRHRSVRVDVVSAERPAPLGYGAAVRVPQPTILLLYEAGGLAFDGSRTRMTRSG
jgi:hypothetical protein